MERSLVPPVCASRLGVLRAGLGLGGSSSRRGTGLGLGGSSPGWALGGLRAQPGLRIVRAAG